MPEPVTFVTKETPALSPENEEMLKAMQEPEAQAPTEEPASLLAGKYKSVEELEKAYKELQSKLGQPKTQEPVDTTEEAEATEEEADEEEKEEEEKPSGNAREIYGELIGSKLEEANIDFESMTERWTSTGKLDDTDYDALEGAGFTRDMVDAYLTGLNYKAVQDSALTVQEINSIKQEYGGEAEYNAMLQWAGTNLSKEEQDAFNQMVNTQPLNVVRLAIAGLHSKYTAAEGREPKLIGGRTSKASTDRFESTAQLTAAMSDPRYKNDPAYRK
jgi:hypothetical protein